LNFEENAIFDFYLFFNVREADCFIKAHLHARFSRKTPATSNLGVLSLGDTTKATVAVACVFAPKNVANVNTSYVMLINIGKVFPEETPPAITWLYQGILTEGEGSVHLIPSLRCIILSKEVCIFSIKCS
jgi:hypothetical protein